MFLRSIRKVAKNGVLIALCMDLDHAYEGGVFVLYTNSDTVYRSLKKPDHLALIEQAFAAVGIAGDQFDVRLKGKKVDAFNAGVNEIQNTFGGVFQRQRPANITRFCPLQSIWRGFLCIPQGGMRKFNNFNTKHGLTIAALSGKIILIH